MKEAEAGHVVLGGDAIGQAEEAVWWLSELVYKEEDPEMAAAGKAAGKSAERTERTEMSETTGEEIR